MVKQYLQRLQTLTLKLPGAHKYMPYVLVFALGVGVTGASYEMTGSDTSPVDRAVAKMQARLQAKSRSDRGPAIRLVERTLPLPVQAPNPRLEAFGSASPSAPAPSAPAGFARRRPPAIWPESANFWPRRRPPTPPTTRAAPRSIWRRCMPSPMWFAS